MRDCTAEILVHITAPSRVADDAKYRHLAQAYLGFEPTTRFPIVSSQGPAKAKGAEDVSRSGPHTAREASAIGSPDLSFRSAFGNQASPPLRQPDEDVHDDSHSSWVAPPSVVQDSLPNNIDTYAQFCSPTRILEHYVSAFDSSQSESNSISQRKSQLNQSPVPLRRSELACSSSSFAKTSPQDASLIPQSPESRKTRRITPVSNQTSFIEETRIASSFPSEISSSYRADSAPPAKRARTSPPPFPGKLVRSSSDGPRYEQARAKRPPHSLDHLEILSPEPPISLHNLQPSDLVTETLLDLAKRVDLRSRYRPHQQARELRPFERGYWMVDCKSWEQDLKDSAWEFLTDYLRNGLVGWGIRCKRDTPFTWMRLYCWGGVVEYMYLVIWVASKRRVRFTGATWVAGDGTSIIDVSARPPSR
ncbi:hypothetical protein B0T16DRAFT_424762 [Cercophora newfieldiana]|uniref:Uncharacterized protein n=1 Tax=Cercophora newfieldiana TaxID=92897 RepID=A0AA39YQZ5_9PEZI|nr:hypothetical protein B0T16DRAFT_424762 [Cercophora newfieldiana]